MNASPLPDPARLVFAAPVISQGEDWRERSLWSWMILARYEGLDVESTDAGGSGFPATWCGNVRVDGLLYRVHRAPRLRFRMLESDGSSGWVLHSATYVEPITAGVEILDPRDDRDTAALPDIALENPKASTRSFPSIGLDLGP